MELVKNFKNYVLESYGEAKKVTWPTKKQTINYSILVIGLSIGFALFFALVDYGLNEVVTKILAR